MGFFTQRCPNCGRSVSKEAAHCNACGCPTASAWSNCHRCGSAVGGDSKFCWKCGAEQDPSRKDKFYGDRWRRAAGDFAVRIDLKTPSNTLHRGLQIDEGTLALVFQGGKLAGTFEAGYHAVDGFFSRMLGFDKGKSAHAILIDARAAEVDFFIENVRVKNEAPVDVRLRLLFQIVEARVFVEKVVGDNEEFTVSDLSNRFLADVREAVSAALREKSLDEILVASGAREILEASVVERLGPILTAHGLNIDGVRLADFGGPAYDELKSKLGDIDRLNRELDVNRRLQDAVRIGKIDAYRDEEALKDAFDAITHESGLGSADREEQRKRFIQAAESQTRLDGLRLDYEARRAEILNRLDEQKLRHQSELADVMAEIDRHRAKFEEDIRQQSERFRQGQTQQVSQAETDLEVARRGIEALKMVKQVKLETREKEEMLNLKFEADKLKLRGGASLQALLSTLSGEQADRVLKLAELEMRKGLSPEQALALIAEQSPEIAPSVAEALKARYSQFRERDVPGDADGEKA